MSNFEIPPVMPITVSEIRKVMSSDKISDADKAEFLRKNRTEIKQQIEISITSSDFASMMEARPLIKFRPLKNSFTKAGDKMILAKSLNIPVDEVDVYIKTTTAKLQALKKDEALPKEEFSKIRTYVYRHGRKDDVEAFLNYELERTKDTEKLISQTLEYGTGGLADYFERPIHRLDEKTLVRLYNIADKNLKTAAESGKIDEETRERLSGYFLAKIYGIKENQKIFKRN